jgi:hypothetical protein
MICCAQLVVLHVGMPCCGSIFPAPVSTALHQLLPCISSSSVAPTMPMQPCKSSRQNLIKQTWQHHAAGLLASGMSVQSTHNEQHLQQLPNYNRCLCICHAGTMLLESSWRHKQGQRVWCHTLVCGGLPHHGCIHGSRHGSPQQQQQQRRRQQQQQ